MMGHSVTLDEMHCIYVDNHAIVVSDTGSNNQ